MEREKAGAYQRARQYFDRSGRLFDSLYSEDGSNIFMRFINKHFRRDIYERYLMTIGHAKAVGARTLLDIGVGGAKYAQGYIESGVERITGIDISSTMLDFARDHVRMFEGHESKFEFKLTSLDEYQSDRTHDVVVAMGLFDYLPEPLKALERICRLCEHSAIVSFPSISFYRTPIRKVRYRIKDCPVYFYREPEIRALSDKSGFASCDITKIRGAGMDYVAVFYR